MTVPTTVKVAFWIFLLGALLDIALSIIGVAGSSFIAAAGGASGDATVATGGTALLWISIGQLAIAVIQLIVLWKMKAGKNWARILITVFEILGLFVLFNDQSIWTIIAVAIGLVAVVLMWLPASNDYFRKTA
ncbi:hypothetical protein [Microbacterium resistens]|uniref:hypothetical protein n=1 Tax=Microbacterium resistens TaxID=156977 RepID=UPI0008361463|nr:hypothetical protein [Microbacterium resistens]